VKLLAGREWFRSTVHALFRALLRVRVTGLDAIPVAEPAVLVTNHVNLLGPVLRVAVTRRIIFLGSERLTRYPLVQLAVAGYGGLFISPADMLSTRLLEAARAVLRSGAFVSIMLDGPEMTGPPRVPKRGAAYLASRLGVDLVPIRISGGWLSGVHLAVKGRLRPPRLPDRAALRRATARLAALLEVVP